MSLFCTAGAKGFSKSGCVDKQSNSMQHLCQYPCFFERDKLESDFVEIEDILWIGTGGRRGGRPDAGDTDQGASVGEGRLFVFGEAY